MRSTSRHELFLETTGNSSKGVVAVLARRLGKSASEIRPLLLELPARIFVGTALQVSDWIDELEALGAQVSVKPELPPVPDWTRRAPLGAPRAHHYQFAHVVLANLFQQCASDLWLLLSTADAKARALHIWRRVGKAFLEEERLEPIDLSVARKKVGNMEIIVITLPSPMAHAEAYFVALVRLSRRQEGRAGLFRYASSLFFWNRRLPPPKLLAKGSAGPFRYLTLERAADLGSGGDRTYLCEWTQDGHVNHGDGPPPQVGPFVEAIVQSTRDSKRPCPCGSGQPLSHCHGSNLPG
jgi:hypothetical protein